MSKKRVLIVGGTGYLGQHLLQSFADAHSQLDLAFTHHSAPPQPLLNAFPNALSFPLDLRTCHGLDAISHSFAQVFYDYLFPHLSLPNALHSANYYSNPIYLLFASAVLHFPKLVIYTLYFCGFFCILSDCFERTSCYWIG